MAALREQGGQAERDAGAASIQLYCIRCERLLQVPNPLRSYEEACRFTSDDLPGLDDLRLAWEVERSRLAFALCDPGRDNVAWGFWARRLAACLRENGRRVAHE